MVQGENIKIAGEVFGVVMEHFLGKPIPLMGLMLAAFQWYRKKFGKSFAELCVEDIDKALVLARTAEYEAREELEKITKLKVSENEVISHNRRIENMKKDLADIILDIRYYETLRNFFINVNKYRKSEILDILKKKPEEVWIHEKFKFKFENKNVEEIYKKLLEAQEGERTAKEIVIHILSGDSEEFASASTYDEILRSLR